MNIAWWTVALQAINVLVLVWLLGRFFWRPLADVVARRQAGARALLAEAAARRDAASAAQAEAERARAGIEAERAARMAAVAVDVAQARAAGVARAELDAQEVLARARAQMTRARDDEHAAWDRQATELATDMARRLAGRLQGDSVREAFLGWLVKALAALPQAQRSALLNGDCEMVGAREWTPEGQSRCLAAIASAVGAAPRMRFSTDPALIEGLELRTADLRIRNSWAADIEQLQAELGGRDESRHG